jgi:hypothetical protein
MGAGCLVGTLGEVEQQFLLSAQASQEPFGVGRVHVSNMRRRWRQGRIPGGLDVAD